jgi:hypothetical protein
LQVRTLAVSSAPEAAREALYPLWSSYYLTATAESRTPIRHLRILSACDNTVLYDTDLPTPGDLVRVPVQPGFYVGVHSKHGLTWRIEVTDTSGHKSRIWAQVSGAQLLPVPELKVNWIDFLRIDAVRRVLREKGDAILPGMRGDSCAYGLVGEDRQLVLFNHPRAPHGFRRYRGPLPTRDTVWIGRYPGQVATDLLGFAEMRGDRPTVYLKSYPAWYSLPIGRDLTGTSSRLADKAVAGILHEVCHACWFARTKTRTDIFGLGEEYDVVPDDTFRALRDAEREALLQASEQETRERASKGLRDYLALGDAWRTASHQAMDYAAFEDKVATTEGFAYWVGSSGVFRLGPMESDPELKVDPFFGRVFGSGSIKERQEFADADRYPSGWTYSDNRPSLYGLAEARTLGFLCPDLLLEAWQQNLSLRDAVSIACGYSTLTTAQKQALQHDACERWRVGERVATFSNQEAAYRADFWRLERMAKAGRAVVLRLLYALQRDEAGPLGRGAKPARVLNGLDLRREHFALETSKLCRIRQYDVCGRVTVDLRIVLDDLHSAVRFTPHGQGIEMTSEDAKLAAECGALRQEGGCITVQVLPEDVREADAMGRKEESTGPVRQAVIPLALLCLPAGGYTGHPRARPVATAPTLTASVAGDYLDAATGQIVYQVVDLVQAARPSPIPIPGETYVVSTTLSDTSCNGVSELSLQGPDGRLLGCSTGGLLVHSLTTHGSFREPALGPSDLTDEDSQPVHRLRSRVISETVDGTGIRLTVEVGYQDRQG